MSRVIEKLTTIWPFVVLGFLVGLMIVMNAPAHGWLTGWDNLHPEFNFKLNIMRSWSAVWQEYQGVGLLGGMGHAADLFRTLFLWALSFIIPVNWLRFVFHMLMVVVGIVGVYTFLYKFLFAKLHSGLRQTGAFAGALFYWLNLGTILYFFVPFEPYSVFWGLFPWEIVSLVAFLKKPNRMNIFWLFIANLAGVAQGYVQTLFVVYMVCVGIFLLNHLIKERSFLAVNKSFMSVIAIIIVNLFWLLPAGYFVTHNFSVHQNANQIQLATEKFFLMNKGRGQISDFALLKFFYYDFTDFDQKSGLRSGLTSLADYQLS